MKRKTRIDKGVPRITKRDIDVFGWIADGEKLSIDLLTILLAKLQGGGREKVSLTRAYQWIGRHAKEGYAEYRAELVGKPGWVNIKKKGLVVAGRAYPETDKSIYWYNHVWACNFVRLWLEEWLQQEGYEYQLITERQLRYETKNQLSFYPDMILKYADAHVTINVELTDKGVKRYEDLERTYRIGEYTGHWYFVPEKLEDKLKRQLGDGYVIRTLESRQLSDGTKYLG